MRKMTNFHFNFGSLLQFILVISLKTVDGKWGKGAWGKTNDLVICGGSNEPIMEYRYTGVCKPFIYQEKEPPIRTSQTQVYFQVVDMQVLEINDAEKTIEINMKYYNVWKDHRLTVNSVFAKKLSRHGVNGIAGNWFDEKDGKRPLIWYPDGIKITNVIDRKLLHHPFTTLIFAKGESTLWPATEPNETKIIQEMDVRISLFCDFDFAMFPLDTQYCRLMESNEDDGGLELLLSPRTSKEEVNTLIKDGFNFTSTMQEYTDKNNTFVGLKIKIQRIISPYVYQYYLPCAAIVVVAQISFIIPPSAIPGRIGLLATLFLTLSNMFISHMVCFVYNDFEVYCYY